MLHTQTRDSKDNDLGTKQIVEIKVEHELDAEKWWEQSSLICTECGVNA
jgi:hypothetical protein